MFISLIVQLAAAVATSGGVVPAKQVRVEISEGAISTLRLPHDQEIMDVSVNDPSVDVVVMSKTTIAVRGAPGPRGVHMLVRRSQGAPFDVALMQAPAGARSQVVDLAGDGTSKVSEWRVDGRRVSVLHPGFAVALAVHTPGVEIEQMAADGAFVATRRSGPAGDVVVYGAHDEVGVYRLD